MQERRVIRRATLNGYREAALSVGLDPDAMLRAVGLGYAAAQDSDDLIAFDAFLQLLALSAERSGMMDFGIRAAHARGIPDLGAISLLMRDAENVEAAIRLYTSHMRLHSDGTQIYLQTGFEYPIIAVEIAGNTMAESTQVTQFGITGVLMQLRWLIGDDYCPELVTFTAPALRDSQFARRVFRCEMLYDQTLSGLVLDRQVLRKPLMTSPPFLRRLAMKQLQPLLERGKDTMAMRVTRMISQRLEDGDFSSQGIADEMYIDRRTLSRRLEAEGTTYQALLQQLREQIIQQAIHNPGISLTELSCSTGFQSLSAFSRWFQTAYGRSASQMRGERVGAARR